MAFSNIPYQNGPPTAKLRVFHVEPMVNHGETHGNGGFSEVQSRHRSSAAGSRRAPKRSGWSTEGVGPGCGSYGEPVNASFVDNFPKNHAMSMNMFIGKRVNQVIVSNAI